MSSQMLSENSASVDSSMANEWGIADQIALGISKNLRQRKATRRRKSRIKQQIFPQNSPSCDEILKVATEFSLRPRRKN
jgi:hypothetical protein